MDIRRTILWVVFSISLMLLWEAWLKQSGQPSLFGGPAATAPAPAGSAPADVPTASAAAAGAVPSGEAAPVIATRKVDVSTDVLALQFDTAGAQLVRAELLRQRDGQDESRNIVLLDNRPGERVYLAQTGLIGDKLPNHRTPFVWVEGPTTLAPGQDKLDVVFEASSGNVKLREIWTLRRGAYDIAVRHEVVNGGEQPVSPSLYLQLTRDDGKPAGESRFYSTYSGPALYSAETHYKKIAWSDIEKNKAELPKPADNGWVGIVQHYFVSAWIPQAGTEREFRTRKVDSNLYAITTVQPLGAIAPGATKAIDSNLFIGPQDQKALGALNERLKVEGLDLVVDYGWLTFIAKPLFWLLSTLHGMLGNWGWSIIALTVIVKAVFYPLSAASYKSMAKMRAVTPRLQKLREQYADDKQKQQMAMMELYRTEKINPLGGCLPILVQIPVFMALYWTLGAAVEMRNAPWIGWIHDLAASDPWFILPAIMVGTMFIQQRLNPTPPDPVQAKMMMFMPLVFGGMMFFFPAGLVLYWCVNNILSIAQQWQITRMIEGKPVFGRA
ncbi:membrane protein insertase YidC [Derxia gummosa]|uniref:Membrane protein insertase YidC n=1 Tax=Derxia gummosa DSM 723 TaxID=1121388 RepID=A0A8B6X552_9BURK|nr:membrane protein insertase YidC [Derxia gummosa]